MQHCKLIPVMDSEFGKSTLNVVMDMKSEGTGDEWVRGSHESCCRVGSGGGGQERGAQLPAASILLSLLLQLRLELKFKTSDQYW